MPLTFGTPRNVSHAMNKWENAMDNVSTCARRVFISTIVCAIVSFSLCHNFVRFSFGLSLIPAYDLVPHTFFVADKHFVYTSFLSFVVRSSLFHTIAPHVALMNRKGTARAHSIRHRLFIFAIFFFSSFLCIQWNSTGM